MNIFLRTKIKKRLIINMIQKMHIKYSKQQKGKVIIVHPFVK